MKSIQINGVNRDAFGKKGAKNIRREGRIPVILYGGENEPVHF